MNTAIGVPTGASGPEPTIGATRKEGSRRHVDLGAIRWDLPWTLLDEYEAAAVLRQSVKLLRRWRHESIGPKFMKVNAVSVRYRVGDLQDFLAAQPTGGGRVQETGTRRGPGRPRKSDA